MFSNKSQTPFFVTPCGDLDIDALELLAKQIATEVWQASMASTAKREVTIQVQYRILLQSLYGGFSQGLAVIGGLMNAVAPINRIPPELLTKIFALSPGTISHTATGAAWSEIPYWPLEEVDVNDLHKLTKVCRDWRDLSTTMPTLWTTIVTHNNSRQRDVCFWRSNYLPDDTSLDLKLTVHFSPPTRGNPKGSVRRMVKFMLTNASKIREWHVWNVSCISDLFMFLQAFDASALEHCTIWEPDRKHMRFPEPGMRTLPLFSGPANRLRSLCLTDIHELPAKEFPALTLLVIAYNRSNDIIVRWHMGDLLTLLAGSPRLEGVYVHGMLFYTYSLPRPPGPSEPEPAPICLPRLQHLAFTYRPETGKADTINPADVLLSRISPIPPACHMVFTAVGGARDERTRRDDSTRRDGSTRRAIDILDTVCRRVEGKAAAAVSHVFIRLFAGSATIQLVFAQGQGSLRLQFPVPAAAPPPARRGLGALSSTSTSTNTGSGKGPLDVFSAFPALFARTEELRVHYTDDSVEAALTASLPAALPALKTMSLVRDFDWERPGPSPGPRDAAAKPTLLAGLMHLIPPEPWTRSPRGAGVPYPALDTLWVALEKADEIGAIESLLGHQAHARVPVRRLVVTVYNSNSMRADAGSDVPARLRALRAKKVVVMEMEEGSAEGEVDWMVKLPAKKVLAAVSDPSGLAGHTPWPELGGVRACMLRDWTSSWVSFFTTIAQEHLP
ncbi:hypothetical protein V8D89_002897 [Ganoderma adspersum]